MRKNVYVVTPRCAAAAAAAAVVSALVLRRPTKEYTHPYSMMHRRLPTAGIEYAPHYHQLLVIPKTRRGQRQQIGGISSAISKGRGIEPAALWSQIQNLVQYEQYCRTVSKENIPKIHGTTPREVRGSELVNPPVMELRRHKRNIYVSEIIPKIRGTRIPDRTGVFSELVLLLKENGYKYAYKIGST